MPTLPLFKTTKLDPVVPPTKSVDVAMSEPVVVVPEIRALPCTDNNNAGVVVPMPTLPLLPTQNNSPLGPLLICKAASLTASASVSIKRPEPLDPSCLIPAAKIPASVLSKMDRLLIGLVVPIPTLPLFNTTKLDPVVPPTKSVDVAMSEPVVVVPEMRLSPCTERRAAGVGGPMPA